LSAPNTLHEEASVKASTLRHIIGASSSGTYITSERALQSGLNLARGCQTGRSARKGNQR
jgi:hypothetical protein